ncbi:MULTISPECIES: ketopantoate reductase family protein [Streptomyces]|uniref:ketopantoate reductase family protein n=1 Tax=Streptomyces TaxID=1883 RepID=UPI0004CC0934|nr:MULTISPECIES: 2-dehydropantoate 2-reductase N-terminal domain-containing protein [unclassified Streptomyces]SEB98977.1 2-dehydropantoate 2-reductase [Streptomyces sp. KS_5]SED38705.1 2-dehydropantoate 2-reductase [Streptomyces sp. PAN_FS17]
MRYVIIGAGAVGGVIGGRLAGSGHEVVLVARGAHFEALREHGLRLRVPEGELTHRLPVVDGPAALGELRPDDVLVLAVKTQDSVAALQTWGPAPVAGGGTAAEQLPVFCAQNGVEGRRLALRLFRRVYGVCVWLPSTYVEPGVVSAAGSPLTGILHLGRHPHGTDETARLVAADLEKSYFEAPVVADVARWEYAKLLSNLGNALEAVTGPVSDEDALALFRRVRAEGAAVLDAAGIAYASTEEQQAVRGDKVTLVPLDGAPRGGGSSWQSLTRGTGTIEADYLNGEIALLGRLHGVRTPLNELLQHLADTFARERRAAGSMPVAELMRLADEAVVNTR